MKVHFYVVQSLKYFEMSMTLQKERMNIETIQQILFKGKLHFV